MMKKLFAVLLVLTLIFGMAMTAYADHDDYDDYDDDYYDYDDYDDDDDGDDDDDDDKAWNKPNSNEGMSIFGDEIYFGNMWGSDGKAQDRRAEIAGRHTPNTVSNTQTIAAGGATMLSINMSRCGVVVVPSTTGKFELSYIGVNDSSLISTSSAITSGTIRFTIKGNNKLEYVNSNPESRVNVVLLKVPAAIRSVYISEGNGSVHLTGLTVPIKGETGSGIIKVMGNTLNAGYDLSAKNGSVILEGGTIGGKIDLSAKNGNVKINGKTVSGDIDLSADNGKASLTANTLGGAELDCDNGELELNVGVITGHVKAEVDNGKIIANLREAPVNLTLNITSRSPAGKITLPTGWSNNSVFGTGIPRLSLSCKNGSIVLTNNA